ncbi:hypothetical protein ABCY62_07285 [Acetivibrio clariflavus]|uniref:hypothetical protein n=1 Tax=Acetivibrio clariflavus TaxID=288965 RepID=UPI0031F5AFBC
MFKFKGRKNVFLGVLLIVATVLLQFSSIALAAPNSESVEMSVEAGYENTVRVRSDAPFYITLVNKGEGFYGEAQVIINTASQSKAVYAINFDLPEGSTKKLTLNVPIITAVRKVQIRIESNGRLIKEQEYSFNKVLPPETPMIGVLGDAYNQLRTLNGLRIKQNQVDNIGKIVVNNSYNDSMGTVIESPAEIIQLNEENLPDDINGLAAFDCIIIADYDTSLLSDKQIKAVEKWLDEGKTLILAGGTNAKKVYSGLSDYLKPFEISGSKKESIAESLEKFTERSAPDALVDLSTGNVGDGKILIGDETTPLAISYKKEQGKLIFIAFDPTMSPISGWASSSEMWKRLMDESMQTVNTDIYRDRDYYRYTSVVHQVPEDQTPPYKTLLLIILAYIIIVGPVLYIILKWRDKRDYSWIVIPGLSVLCLGIIYAAGLRTRYTSAVMNNYSIIHLNSDSKKAEIQTYSGVFNNRPGKMVIEYSKDYKVETLRENDYYYDYRFNVPDEEYEKAQIKSKIYANDPVRHEIFNVTLWEPSILKTSQVQEYSGNLIKSVSLNGKEVSVELVNDTGFAFEDSFIVVGENYVDVGNLLPNEEKKITFSLDDTNIAKSLYSYLDSKYFDQSNTYNNWPKNWREQSRRRNALESFDRFSNNNILYNNYKNTKVVFVALNFENVDYGLKINGKKPKTYDANVIFATNDLYFEEGKRYDIPKGIIGPVFEGGEYVDFYGAYDEGMVIYADTEVFYRFEIPRDMTVDKFTIDWSAAVPEYMKEMYSQGVLPKDQFGASYELFIYNNALSDWEKMDDVFEAEEETKNYINDENIIKVKIAVNIDETVGRSEYVWKPEISLSGVRKNAGN